MRFSPLTLTNQSSLKMTILKGIILISVLVLVQFNEVRSSGLTEDFTWTRINYDWSKFRTRSVRQASKYNGAGIVFPGQINMERPRVNNSGGAPGDIDYQYENNIPMGANVWQNKLFITVPRRRLGVPSTLNYVKINGKGRHNVPLIPYPNAQINSYPSATNNNSFVSTYRVAIDACDRLWFVDTGTIELPGNITRVQPHSINVIDLNTDQIVHRFVLPESVLQPASILAAITLDVTKENCNNALAYIPDVAGYGLVVYSLRENRAWRVTHNFFFLEPAAGEFFIAGHNFQWNDGVFSAELTAVKPDGFRDMYFHSMAGHNMYRVSTRVLRNQTQSTRSYHGNDFQLVGNRGPNSQTSSADIHPTSGVMFLGLVNQNALGCWKVGDQLDNIAIVQKDDGKMVYPCDVKVYNDNIYLLTNTMPEFLYGQLNYDQVNFCVWSNTVAEAVRGTSCTNGPSSSKYSN